MSCKRQPMLRTLLLVPIIGFTIVISNYKTSVAKINANALEAGRYERQIAELKLVRDQKLAQIKAAQTAPEAAQAPPPAPAPEPQQPPVAPVEPNASGAKLFIYMHESGNNPSSVAPNGACGLGQALPCSKMPCALGDYGCQDAYFTQYMQSRYGTWESAMAFWQANRWW